MWRRAACFALPPFVPERLFILLSVFWQSRQLSVVIVPDPQSQHQQRYWNRSIINEHVSPPYVARSNIPRQDTQYCMCDEIMWLTYKCDHREVWGTGCVPPAMTTGIQIYSHILFLDTPSHLAPQSVSCVNKTCCQIVRNGVTDWWGRGWYISSSMAARLTLPGQSQNK